MNAAYQLSSFTGITTKWRLPQLFRDQETAELQRWRDAVEVEAEVSSGDYFVTIATRLDAISRLTSDYSVKIYLENLVSDLIYLQDNYTINKNK